MNGYFVAPSVVRVNGISEIEREIFGPVLHVATFKREELKHVLDDINQRKYGLTFGLHTRIDDRVELVTNQINAGNFYINRNQIGAVVGSQPFGGENLSGTGPKAGGPHYLQRFLKPKASKPSTVLEGRSIDLTEIQQALDALVVQRTALSNQVLPGPTGESNQLTLYPRGRVLCLGPSSEMAKEQARIAEQFACTPIMVCPGASGDNALDGLMSRQLLTHLHNVELVVCWSDASDCREIREALSRKEGALIPFVAHRDLASYCVLERQVCIDTTAAGGNASLLAVAS